MPPVTSNAGDSPRNGFETAAEHACTAVPIATPLQLVGEVLACLAARRYASASHIAVCEGDRYLGIAP